MIFLNTQHDLSKESDKGNVSSGAKTESFQPRFTNSALLLLLAAVWASQAPRLLLLPGLRFLHSAPQGAALN